MANITYHERKRERRERPEAAEDHGGQMGRVEGCGQPERTRRWMESRIKHESLTVGAELLEKVAGGLKDGTQNWL